MAPSSTKHAPFIADIEVLRAIAVLFTIGQHLPLLLFWTDWTKLNRHFTCWGGVDLFFCISGFVIIRSIKAACWEGGGWRGFLAWAPPFWVRRMFRILPSAWLWLALTLAATAWFNRSGAFGPMRENATDAAAAVLQLANLHWLGCLKFGIGQCNMTTWTLGAYWSLSLEEQFYLLLPVALALASKRVFLAGLVVAVVLQMIVARPAWDPLWAFRTDTLLLGVALGLWQGHASHARLEPTFLRRPIPSALLRVGVLGLLGAIPASGLQLSTGLLALCCAGLVFIASHDGDYIWAPGLVRRGLIWVGARSYAIYLIHVPIFDLTREIWFRLIPPGASFGKLHVLPFLATAAVLVVGLAEVNYRLVETPLRNKGKRLAATLAERWRG